MMRRRFAPALTSFAVTVLLIARHHAILFA